MKHPSPDLNTHSQHLPGPGVDRWRDALTHPFHTLFAQLGLPCDAQGIALFLQAHRPLAGDVALPDAAFWSPSQASFLREALAQDNDWSQQVDQLSKALR